MIVRSKSPISSPMVGRAKSPVGGSEKAASPPKASNANLGRNPELVKRYRILDKREGFVGPFVIEYECVDSATNKIFWATDEDLDDLGSRFGGVGLGSVLIHEFETNPPPPRKREALVVPEEKPVVTPSPAPTPSHAAAAPPPLKRKVTLLDKLEGAVNSKLGGGGSNNGSPRRQVPPLDVNAARDGGEQRKSPREKEVLARSPREAEKNLEKPEKAVARSPREPDKKIEPSPREKSPREAEKIVVRSPREPEKKTESEKSPRDPEKSVVRSPRELEKTIGRTPREGEKAGARSPREQDAEKQNPEMSDHPPQKPGTHNVSPREGKSLVERMRTLKQLYSDGLISEQEFQAKRKAMLDEL